MTWKTMLASIVIAIVVTGPITGAWGLKEPVTESPDGQVLFNCGTALHEHAPTPDGQPDATTQPRSACDRPVTEAKILAVALISVGLASWAVIGVVLLRRRRARLAADSRQPRAFICRTSSARRAGWFAPAPQSALGQDV